MATWNASGTFDYRGDVDWFRIRLTAGTSYYTFLSNARFSIYRPDQSLQTIGFGASSFTATASGDYYISIDTSSTTGGYNLQLFDYNDEVPSWINTPLDISFGETLFVPSNNFVSNLFPSDRDWIAFDAIAGTNYFFTFGNSVVSNTGRSLKVVDADGDTLSLIFNTIPTLPDTCFFVSPTSKRYYLEVNRPDSIGSYSVALSSVTDDFSQTTSTTGILQVGSSAVGTFEVRGDADWYAISLDANTSYNFNLSGVALAGETWRIRLADADGRILQQSWNNSATLYTPRAAGTYYVSAELFSSVLDGAAIPRPYTLTASTVADDVINNINTAGSLIVGGTISSAWQSYFDADWFRVTLTAGQSYRFTQSGSGNSGLQPQISLFDQNGTFLRAGRAINDGTQLSFTAATAGTYFVSAAANRGYLGTYSIAANTYSDDFADNPSTTAVLTVGGSATSQNETSTDVDWFAVTLTADTQYVFSGDFRNLYDSTGASILVSGVGYRPTTSGTYYVAASSSSGNTTTVGIAIVTDDFLPNSSTSGVLRLLRNGSFLAETLNDTVTDDEIRAGDGDDTINSGLGGNDIYDGGAGIDTLSYAALGSAIDVRLNQGRSLVGGVQRDIITGIEILIATGFNDNLVGNGDNNTIFGGNGDDTFDLSQGGNDTANGGDGNDSFFFGATFAAADVVDGGTGTNDQIGLQGNYAALTLGANATTNVEVLSVLPGTGFSYNITTVDANVAAGQELVIFGTNLGATNNLTFNGSAETDGNFRVYGGLGIDTITTGAGNDGIYFGPGRFGASDVINGGLGTNDQVALDGNYTATISGTQLQNVELLALLRGVTGDLANYNITLTDDLIGAGQTFTVFGLAVETGYTLNATAETNGNVSVFGGSGGDTITTGVGNDRIFGGGGADVLNGGVGTDTFVYDAVSQSTGATYDRVIGFVSGVDRLDFNFTVTGVDATVGAGTLSTASFDANLAAVIGAGQLAASHAVLFQADAGDLAGLTFLVVDANGVAGYQAGSDYVIQLTTPPASLVTGDFI